MRQQRAPLPFRLSVHLLPVRGAAAHRVRCLRGVGKPLLCGTALCRQPAGCSAARALRPAQGARLLDPRPRLLRRQPAASPPAPLGSTPATRCPRPQVCLAPQLVPLNITLRDNYGAALRNEVGMAPLSSVDFSVVPATGSDIAVANASWSGAALAAAQPTGFVMRLLLPEPGLFLVSITVDGSLIPTSPFYLHVELLVCPSPLQASPDGLCLCPYGEQPGPGGCAAGDGRPTLSGGAGRKSRSVHSPGAAVRRRTDGRQGRERAQPSGPLCAQELRLRSPSRDQRKQGRHSHNRGRHGMCRVHGGFRPPFARRLFCRRPLRLACLPSPATARPATARGRPAVAAPSSCFSLC